MREEKGSKGRGENSHQSEGENERNCPSERV
jgi:hypothetical protein